MHTDLKSLRDQALDLQLGIESVSAEMEAYENNIAGIQECALTLQKCIRIVGNNRVAAMAAKDQRKIMAQMEDTANELVELLKR
ncbi:hypothetical protein Q4498_17615 [Neptunomonas phycophila]|uniref:hypothetical protein n=1 Tax=Neptunomonas phycophila TaxID=1572645 RepID=UPI0026E29D22|nr:hypothetical protein [Neptunomonas phycophila]MDO6469930.1 hypothetical protein [Neptunomonas phycophila]